MPRPVQINAPVPRLLLAGFGGAANTNILPTTPYAGNYSPFAWNPPVAGSSNIVPVASTLVVGASLSNKVVLSNYAEMENELVPNGPVTLNWKLVINSIADLSAQTITIRGRDANHQIITEDITGPTAAGFVITTNYYAYLDYFSVSADTADDNFSLNNDLEFTTQPIRLDYFYPNTSYAVSGQIFGTGATYTAHNTIQKVTLFTNEGIAYTNPNLFWENLDASLTNATTNVIFSTSKMCSAIYFSCSLADNASYMSFTVLQQGVR